MNTVKILLIGDVVGTTGRAMLQRHIDTIRKQYSIDGVIVNGENSANNGRGITSRIMKFFKHNDVDVVTSGNHIWHNREIYSYLDQHTDLLRPANFPSGVPGVGVTTFDCSGVTVGVVNLQGRVFMRDLVDDPFKTIESILTYLKTKTKVIIVDFHAEASSEKMAMAHFLDGQVSTVVGTHTHIQTADDRILPGGTAYITDLGMTGSYNSMLGMKKEAIIEHFLKQMPVKFTVDESSPVIMCGVWVEIDIATGKSIKIERIKIIDDNLDVGGTDHE